MGNYGIRYSTAGNHADTQQDVSVGYSSKFTSLKILLKKHLRITTNGSGAGVGAVVHGLGYAPTFYVWRKATASFSFLDASSYTGAYHPMPGTPSCWIPYHLTTNCYTDASQLRIEIQGANSTSYDFLVYIFVDQAEVNNEPGLDTTQDYGMKVTKNQEDALQSSEQKLAQSSSYKTLNYYPQMVPLDAQISLPAINGDYFDTNPQEGTYVDFFHTLGYPPFFLAYASGGPDSTSLIALPDATTTLFGSADYSFTAWADKTRIRISLHRKAHYSAITPVSFSATGTLHLKLFVFLDNLDLEL